ncbi:MAG TPA: 2-phospho-L-lactate guanylyltransferase [Pseudomonadales bacterium]
MWVVLPVKTLAQSKQRLAGVLDQQQRCQLAEAMLEDMLNVLTRSDVVSRILVVSRDPHILQRVTQHAHVDVLPEPPHCQDLNEAVSLAVEHARLHGAKHILVLHADMPLLNHDDLAWLAHHHAASTVTLVPDRAGDGTNGMLLDAGCTIPFCYGPGSFLKHLNAARQSGIDCRIGERVDLMLDIDSAADLDVLASRVADAGVSTSAWLQQHWPRMINTGARP